MFDKRLFGIVPKGIALLVGDVVLKLVGLLAHIGVVAVVAYVLATLLESGHVPAGLTGRFLLAFVLIGVNLLANMAARRLGMHAASQGKKSARQQVFDKLVRLGASWQEHTSQARASQLLGEGIERLDLYLGSYLPQFFYAVLAPLLIFAFLLPRCAVAAVVMLVCVPLIPMSIIVLMKAARKAAGEQWDSYTDLSGLFLEAISGLTTLKVFGADARKQRELATQAEGFRAQTMRILTMQLGNVTVMDVFSYGGAAAGTIIALVSFAGAHTTLEGALMVCLLAIDMFMPMRKLGSFFHTAMNAQAVIDELFDLLALPEPQGGTVITQSSRAGIELADVGYAYPDGRCALSGVHLTAEPGSFIGITGESGSGKSTLGHVMSGGFLDYSGHVLVDGVELRDLSAACLHATVTYVSSSSAVFKGTLRSNLELGNPDATDAQMWTALHRCKLSAYAVMNEGLDTPVAEGGANLSGGQRQRLCFARALLHDTPIYIFDEATSNVDAASETALLEFIQELAVTKTVVVISHRLAVLKWTDCVYVLRDGNVVESGSHVELLRQGGYYRRLWDRQFELEEFARKAAGGILKGTDEVQRPDQERLDRVASVIAQMPAKVGAIMQAAVETAPMRDYIAMAQGRPKSGHPSWIPIDDTSEKPQGVGEDTLALGASDTPGTASKKCASRSGLSVVMGLARHTKEQWPLLLRAVLLGSLAAIVVAALPVIAAMWLAVGAPTGGMLVATCVAIALCGLLRGVLRYGERLATHDQTFRTLAILRDRVFGAMRRLAPARLEARDKGDLVSLLTTDIDLLERLYSKTLAPVVIAVVVAVVAVVFIALRSGVLGVLALVGYLVVGVIVPVLSARATEPATRRVRELAVRMNSFVIETMAGLTEVIQYGWVDNRSEDLSARMGGLSNDERTLARRAALAATLPHPLVLFVVVSAVIVAIWQVGIGSLSAADALVCVVALWAAFDPITEVAGLGVSLGQTVAAGARILDILDEEPATPDVVDGISLDAFTGARVINASFAYEPHQPILIDSSIEIPQGSIVRIIGPSGAGKSTLLKLCMRFWDVDSGRIEISDHDIREIHTSALRSLEGYMTQSTFLFTGTLRQNIMLARPDATEAQLNSALTKASLGDVIERLPQGLDTEVSAVGIELSSGELQRIGLARVFLHDAPFLLLDEPTSNLDVLNEAAVLRAIDQERAGKTILIVSHRPAAAAISDVTYTIDSGRDS